jgi:pimeloyl-ACP methyl ester carboxylesterase
VILLDRRGTGYSKPDLRCPELDRVAFAAYPAPPARAAYLAGVRACKARLVGQGVDLGAYTDAESAQDVVDLRKALGLASWNLLALSAGGELALRTMALDPNGTRSVVFDSAWSNRTLWGPNFWRNAQRYLDVLFGRCSAEPACRRSYPQLAADFERLTKRLDATPVTVTVPKPSPALPKLLDEAVQIANARPDIQVGPPQYLPGNRTAILPLTYTSGDDKAIDIV